MHTLLYGCNDTQKSRFGSHLGLDITAGYEPGTKISPLQHSPFPSLFLLPDSSEKNTVDHTSKVAVGD